MKLRSLIVDDEPLARQSLRYHLREHPEIEIVEECGNGTVAVERILSLNLDLVFLDMQMPGMSGMDVVKQVGEAMMPLTIFVTAHSSYAAEAFDIHAADFVLKPFGRDRFEKALTRVMERLRYRNDIDAQNRSAHLHDSLDKEEKYSDRITINMNGKFSLIRVRDISLFRAVRNGVELSVGSKLYETRDSLNALEKKLDPEQFVRIHRSTIVRVDEVIEVQPWFNGFHVVVLKNGNRLRMSRYQQEALRRLLGYAI